MREPMADGRVAVPTIPGVTDALEHDVDPRFSLANERTFLAWIGTALAMVVAVYPLVALVGTALDG